MLIKFVYVNSFFFKVYNKLNVLMDYDDSIVRKREVFNFNFVYYGTRNDCQVSHKCMVDCFDVG